MDSKTEAFDPDVRVRVLATHIEKRSRGLLEDVAKHGTVPIVRLSEVLTLTARDAAEIRELAR